MQSKHYYSIDEFRNIAFSNAISKSTVLNMVRSGKIPTIKIMARRFIPKWYLDKTIAVADIEPGTGVEK